jgi:hypothetical protein
MLETILKFEIINSILYLKIEKTSINLLPSLLIVLSIISLILFYIKTYNFSRISQNEKIIQLFNWHYYQLKKTLKKKVLNSWESKNSTIRDRNIEFLEKTFPDTYNDQFIYYSDLFKKNKTQNHILYDIDLLKIKKYNCYYTVSCGDHINQSDMILQVPNCKNFNKSKRVVRHSLILKPDYTRNLNLYLEIIYSNLSENIKRGDYYSTKQIMDILVVINNALLTSYPIYNYYKFNIKFIRQATFIPLNSKKIDIAIIPLVLSHIREMVLTIFKLISTPSILTETLELLSIKYNSSNLIWKEFFDNFYEFTTDMIEDLQDIEGDENLKKLKLEVFTNWSINQIKKFKVLVITRE